MQQIQITLHPDGVSAPAVKAALECSEVVRFCLHALSAADLEQPPPFAGMYHLEGPKLSADNRRQLYTTWILGKAFQELTRGVRAALEEAYLFVDVAAMPASVTTLAQLESSIESIRKRANKASFPVLLEHVNAKLAVPMAFENEFRSLQSVRNCLEHRGGVVGATDVDENGILTLSIPRLKCFYKRGDEEVEIAAGHVVDPGDAREQVEVLMRRDTRIRTYQLGEQVTFTADELYETAFACNLFASDLASKLPVIGQAAT